MPNPNPFFFFFFLIFFLLFPPAATNPPAGGEWTLLHSSIGISAMHMQLLHNNMLVIFDRTDFGPSNLSLPAGHCRSDPTELALKYDCTAHSLLYHIPSNTFSPLTVQTDTWCSSGAVLPNGTLIQTGGYNDGDRVVRIISPCDPSDGQDCDWTEIPSYLSVRRWYATNQILPDGRIIIIGGRRQFSYEFFPKELSGQSSNYRLDFLQETRDQSENNLYPFLHLLPDGNLFIFANTRSILFDYVANRVLREYPEIPNRDPRNYPSSGSSVLLPIRLDEDTESDSAEVMVCGGAPQGSFQRAGNGTFVHAVDTCGRIRVTDSDPKWEMEDMPVARVMGDMLLLPTGDVLIINGAMNGTAGWELAREPVLNPVLYELTNHRFLVLNPSPIPRLYHSASVLSPDGRILVGGSNPHVFYNFTGVLYPTELSLEAFSPPYLSDQYAAIRPRILFASPNDFLTYRQTFTVNFYLTTFVPRLGFGVTLLTPSFTTHGLAMNQRLMMLKVGQLLQISAFTYEVVVMGPPTATIAPPGYYLLFVVHAGVPSEGIWLKIQ
ncbi:glyoxal oxidase-related protein [Tasmannia lanceolata]|uniref:glyoxal oxidase-related protein n=1 Tax=Tasmannia lanceolata TaxID=3420 RepID=UPI004063A321